MKFKEDMTDMLVALSDQVDDLRPHLRELGEYMVSRIKQAITEQRGLGNMAPYRPVGAQYASRKKRAGGNPNRIMFGPTPGRNVVERERGGAVRKRTHGGDLIGSWKRLKVTKDSVLVGAARKDSGGTANEAKARGNDDRLDIAWNGILFADTAEVILDSVVNATNAAAPPKVS